MPDCRTPDRIIGAANIGWVAIKDELPKVGKERRALCSGGIVIRDENTILAQEEE
jgi:hypothetical protein